MIRVGSVVISKAGRDKGKKLIVVEMERDEYALVADGGLRKVEKPKKKKLRHLQSTQEVYGGELSNSFIKDYLGGVIIG